MSASDSKIKALSKYFPWTTLINRDTNTVSLSSNGLKSSKSFVEITHHYSIEDSNRKNYLRRYSNFFGTIDKTDGINFSETSSFYQDLIMLWNKLNFDNGMDKCKFMAQSICDHWLPNNEISWLIRHENIVDNVRLLDTHDTSTIGIKGKLHITVTHLIFLSDDLKEEKWILIHLISSVDSPNVSSMGKLLSISTKDFHTYSFMIEDTIGCDKLRLVLLRLVANIDQYEKLPCFSGIYFKKIPQSLGWLQPNERLKSSFRRMGLPNNQWKFTDINENYKMSDTYPAITVIPEGTSKSIIEACSKFRSRGRFPALTYYYSHKKSAMCRCSQPLVGFSARCNEDITMLKRIKDAALEGHTDRLHVVDTRPKINALTNRARGKGYESDIDYEKIVFQFFQIENIHVMRSSLEKMLKIFRNSKHSVPSSLEKSGWLKHIKWILDASFYIARKLQVGENVVVHCSDGWDRTSQVCSLTQIILDPYYRTIEGLEDVIEKDWLSFGHKFSDRCGHLSVTDQSEVSPVFTQFLDCIYQLYNCYPEQFEYNERLLRHLHRWSQDCIFGTFVGNCEKDRLDLKLHERTHSVWAYVKYHLWDYINPYYRENESIPVLPELKIMQYSSWSVFYCPIVDMNNINSCLVNVPDEIFTMQQLTKSIKYQNDYIYKKSSQLIKLLSNRINNEGNYNKKLSSALTGFAEIEKQITEADGDQINNNKNDENDQKIAKNDWNQSLRDEMSFVAVDTATMILQKSCNNCNHNLDKLLRTNLCFSCGQFFCLSCIQQGAHLPGHGCASDTFPVCLLCSEKIEHFLTNNSEKGGQHITTNGISKCISDDPLMDMLHDLVIH